LADILDISFSNNNKKKLRLKIKLITDKSNFFLFYDTLKDIKNRVKYKPPKIKIYTQEQKPALFFLKLNLTTLMKKLNIFYYSSNKILKILMLLNANYNNF